MGEVIFSSIVVIALELVVAVAVGVYIWSVVRSILKRDKGSSIINGIPTRTISRSIAILTFILLAATFILGSKAPIMINGLTYDSSLWLKMSDMFVISLIIMLLLATIAVVADTIRTKNMK